MKDILEIVEGAGQPDDDDKNSLSTWITLTVEDHLGGVPKCSIQFNLAPTSRTTSASSEYWIIMKNALIHSFD